MSTSAFGTGDGAVRVLDDEVRVSVADAGPLKVGFSFPADTRAIEAVLRVEGPAIESVRAPGLQVVQMVLASATSRLSSWPGRSRAERSSSSSRRQGTDTSLYPAELLLVAVEGLTRSTIWRTTGPPSSGRARRAREDRLVFLRNRSRPASLAGWIETYFG